MKIFFALLMSLTSLTTFSASCREGAKGRVIDHGIIEDSRKTVERNVKFGGVVHSKFYVGPYAKANEFYTVDGRGPYLQLGLESLRLGFPGIDLAPHQTAVAPVSHIDRKALLEEVEALLEKREDAKVRFDFSEKTRKIEFVPYPECDRVPSLRRVSTSKTRSVTVTIDGISSQFSSGEIR